MVIEHLEKIPTGEIDTVNIALRHDYGMASAPGSSCDTKRALELALSSFGYLEAFAA